MRGAQELVNRYISPVSRVQEGFRIARGKAVTSMIDLSDGLSTDIGHICDTSNVGVQLFASQLPISSSLRKLFPLIGKDVLGFALNGGDDYELCFTAPVDAQRLTPASIIGEVLPKEKGRWLVLENGKKVPLQSKGWNHLT